MTVSSVHHSISEFTTQVRHLRTLGTGRGEGIIRQSAGRHSVTVSSVHQSISEFISELRHSGTLWTGRGEGIIRQSAGLTIQVSITITS